MGSLAMGRLALATVAALLLLGATACGERSEPTGPAAAFYPLTVQAGDRPLVVIEPARRIAVLDPPSSSIVRALGAGRRIVGPSPAAKIDFAALRRAHPDLIVASEDADERALSRAASLTQADVYTVMGGSIRQVERSITQLGLLTNTPVHARALVRHIETQRRRVNARLKAVQRVTVFVDTGFFTTVSDQSLIGDLIREARGINVAGSTALSGPVYLPDLLELDPDQYMATSDSDVTLADLRRNRRARKLRAVREGHFAIADADLLQPGPRIGEGLLEIATLLHPNAFR